MITDDKNDTKWSYVFHQGDKSLEFFVDLIVTSNNI